MSKDSAIVLYGPNERPVTDALEGREPRLQDGRLMADGMSPMEKMQLLPVETQQVVLEEYDRRRDHFFRWLMEKFKEGLHYGFPPGCRQGNVDPRQWVAKPSLYDAGAKLLIDVLQLHPRYKLDRDTWEVLGRPPGVICWICELKVRGGHRIVGVGHGSCSPASKSSDPKCDPNSRVKIAKKRARVDAVHMGIPVVGEIFTQDMEKDTEGDAVEPPKPAPPKPEPPKEPRATRDQRAELELLSSSRAFEESQRAYLARVAANPQLTEAKAGEVIAKAHARIEEVVTIDGGAPEEPPIGEPPDDDSEREPGQEG